MPYEVEKDSKQNCYSIRLVWEGFILPKRLKPTMRYEIGRIYSDNIVTKLEGIDRISLGGHEASLQVIPLFVRYLIVL